MLRAVQRRQPSFRTAVAADVRLADGRPAPTSRPLAIARTISLVATTDAFGALVVHRLRARCQRAGVPVVPRLAHHLSILWGQVVIGDPVLLHPGVSFPHGRVVLAGFVEVGTGTCIGPYVTLGLVDGNPKGPTLGRDVVVGAGAKIVGPVVVGDGATIGPNAVVLTDVAPGATVGGVPARPVDGPDTRSSNGADAARTD